MTFLTKIVMNSNSKADNDHGRKRKLPEDEMSNGDAKRLLDKLEIGPPPPIVSGMPKKK